MPQKQPSVPLVFPVSITCEIFSLRGLPHGLEMFSLRNHDWMPDGPSPRCFTVESIKSLGGGRTELHPDLSNPYLGTG